MSDYQLGYNNATWNGDISTGEYLYGIQKATNKTEWKRGHADGLNSRRVGGNSKYRKSIKQNKRKSRKNRRKSTRRRN